MNAPLNDSSRHPALSTRRAGRLMRAATYASLTVATTLVLAKVGAWLATDSVSLLSTLVDSLLDIGASGLTFVAVRQATQPPDHDHRFGHGKAESLGGLGQSAFVFGSGIFVVVQAVQRLLFPIELSNTEVGYAVMGLGMICSLALVLFQRYVVRKTGSVAIGAESLNYTNDILVNASVMVSLAVTTGLDWPIADPLFAIGIATYIMWGAWRIGRRALDILMDRELPDDDRERIRILACDCKGVRGVHAIRTRSSGLSLFVQLHVELADNLPLKEAHDVVEAVERALAAAYPNADILIHADPESVVPAERGER